MGWGVMMGLGQGLQQVSGMMLDQNKAKMAEKLELEREQRAAEREERIFQRNQNTYGQTVYEQDGEGVWWEIDKAKNNSTLDRRLAPKSKIDEFTNASRLDTLNISNIESQIEKRGLEAELTRLATGSYAEDKALERQRTQAQINADNARAGSYSRANRGKAAEDGAAPEESAVVSEIVKELGSYGEDVPKTELVNAARTAREQALAAARKGIDVDPVELARTILENRYGKDREVTGKPTQINWR